MPAAGLRILPDTDDPPLQRIDAGGCWVMMVRNVGFTPDDRCGFMLNGVDAAFIAQADKPGLRPTFIAELDRLRADLDMPP
jgi:adenosine deaminase